jgi:hypothetical protein
MNNPSSPLNPFLFKQVPGGYEFRSPAAWMFGPTKLYHLTDAQKEEMSGPTRSDMALAVLSCALASLVIFYLAPRWLGVDFLDGRNAASGMFSIVPGAVPVLVGFQCFRWLGLRRLRPVLARARPIGRQG